MDYKVQRGDTLSALAGRHDTTVDAIMAANRSTIANRDKILAGATIVIPAPVEQAAATAAQVQPKAAHRAARAPGTATASAPVAAASSGAATLARSPVTNAYSAPAMPYASRPQVATPAPQPVAAPAYEPAVDVASAYRTSSEDHAYEQRVVDLVNQIRAEHGLGPLAYEARLDRGAEWHTQHQAAVGRMGHEGIGDGTPQERMTAVGWNAVWGENAAVGQLTPEQVVSEWMASPGHRDNILRSDYRFLSVGYTTSADGRPYWTQAFGA